MFESSNLDLAQYTPVGDIAVMAMCIIMGILLRQSYISSSRQRFHLLTLNLFAMVIASAANILFQMALNSSELNPPFIYTSRIVHSLLISIVLLLYLQYLNGPLWIPHKQQHKGLIHSSIMIVAVAIADIIGTVSKFGFYITKDGEYHSGINLYAILMAMLMFKFIYVLIKYRSRLLRQVFIGMIIVSVVSSLMLVVQERNYQVS